MVNSRAAAILSLYLYLFTFGEFWKKRRIVLLFMFFQLHFLLQYLCNKEPKILAIIGSGVQARSHYQALSVLYTFQEVRGEQ